MTTDSRPDPGLTEINRADLPVLKAWINDPEMMFYSGVYRPVPDIRHEKWFESVISDPAALVFGWRLADGVLAGLVQLVNTDGVARSAELRIRIGRNHWGLGHGRRAVAELVKYGFRTYNLNRIYLYVADYNLAAIKIYEKNGFRREGVLRQASFANGRFCDLWVMGILSEEFNRNP
jgi:RimJ/RimL family protein N-acetyltransferase